MTFGEDAAKLLTDFLESIVPSDMIEFEALPYFTVAGWTEVEGTAIRLLQVIDTHHEALVQSAMPESKHMAKLMRGQLYYSHKRLTLELLVGIIFFLCPLGHESVDAVDTTVSVTVPKAKVTEIASEKIYVCKAYNSQSIAVAPLYWSHEFLQDVNGVVLCVIEVVSLSINTESLNPVICLSFKYYYATRHVESFHPLLKLDQVLFCDS